MGFLDFINPIAAAVFGGGSVHAKTPMRNLAPVRLTLPQANPDWNTATVRAPVASQHGWSANSLQSYLQNFQNLGGPAAGQQIATNEQLFQPALNQDPSFKEASKNPAKFMKDQASAPGSANVIPSLVANSVGGDMSPAAASLYGRMLGATPPNIVAATAPATNPKPPVDFSKPGPGNPYIRNGAYTAGFSAGQNSLYKGMTPLQRQQANAVYNVTQPVSPTLK